MWHNLKKKLPIRYGNRPETHIEGTDVENTNNNTSSNPRRRLFPRGNSNSGATADDREPYSREPTHMPNFITDDDVQKEREIAAAAHRLGEDIQHICLAAKTGSRRNVIKEVNEAWKLRLLQVLGGAENTEAADVDLEMDGETNVGVDVKGGTAADAEIDAQINGTVTKVIKSDVDILLENAESDKFVLRCMENELPPNLIHCLRLLRVVELQSAHLHKSNQRDGLVQLDEVVKPMSELATSKIEKLLCLLCTDDTVGEQLRPHLFGLFALSGTKYPTNGTHIANTSSNIIIQIARKCLSNSLVWFLHDKQMIMRMTDDARELCGMTEAASPGCFVFCLHAEDAEASGLWVMALKAIVHLVKFSCNHNCDVLLKDFDSSGGYHVLYYAISKSGSTNLKTLIRAMVVLLSCKCGAFLNKDDDDRVYDADINDLMKSFDAGGRSQSEDGLVKNPIAFEVIENLLHRSVPFLIHYHDQYKDRPVIEIGDKIRELAAFSLEVAEKIVRHPEERNQMSPEIRNPFLITSEILITMLQIFSDHPSNFSIMEEKYNILTLYLLSFSTFSDIEFKTMILKTLEFVCTTEPDSNCEKSLHMACEIFFCLCKTLLRLHVEGEEENKEVINFLKEDAFLLCDTLEKLLEVNYSLLTLVMVDVGVMEEKIDEFFALIMESCPSHTWSQNDILSQTAVFDPPSTTAIDQIYSAFCRIIDFVVKGNTAVVSSPLQPNPPYTYRPRHHAISRNRDLNLLLATGINKLGNESSDAALKVFSSKMGLTGDEGLLADMECVLDILDRFSGNFYQITGAGSVETSITDKKSMVEVVQAGGNSIIRVQKLLAMLKHGLKTNQLAQDAFRKRGGFESLVRLLLCLGGVTSPVLDVVSQARHTESIQCILTLVEETFGVLDASIAPITEKDTNSSTLPTVSKSMDECNASHVVSISPSSTNRTYVRDNGIYAAIVKAVASMGLLVSPHSAPFIMNLALESMHPKLCLKNHDTHVVDLHGIDTESISILNNPDASGLILDIAIKLSRTNSLVGIAEQAIDQLLGICAPRKAGTTLGQIADCGLCHSLTNNNGFAFIYDDIEHPLFSRFVVLLRRIATFKMSCVEFVGILRCIAGPLLLAQSEQEGSSGNRNNRIIRLPVIGSSVGSSSDVLIPGEGSKSEARKAREKNLCTRLGSLCTIAERGDKIARCIVGGISLNNIALFMSDVPMDELLYLLAEQGRLRFIEVEKVYASANFVTSVNNVVGVVPISPVEKTWGPASSSGFSYSVWLRLSVSDSDENASGNIFILDLSGPPGQTKCDYVTEGQREFLSVWYDFQSQGFTVMASSSVKAVCFPISPLSLDVWHHVLLTFQPSKRTMALTKKTVLGLCVDGRALEADIKIDPLSLPPKTKLYIGVPNPFIAGSGMVRGDLPLWELGSTLLMSTILGPRDAMSIFAAGPDFCGQFWGDRPQRLSLTATATTTFSMLAGNGELGSLSEALKRRGVSDEILNNSSDSGPDPDSLSYMGLFCSVSPEYVVCAFRASSSTSNSNHRSHYSRRLMNIASINSNNGFLSTDAVVYGTGSIISPNCFADNVQWVGGPIVLLPIVNAAQSPKMLALALRLIRESAYRHAPNLEMLQAGGGYRILGLLLRQKGMMDGAILEECFAFAVDGFVPGSAETRDIKDNISASFRRDKMHYSWSASNRWVLVDLDAMKYLLLNHQVWDLQKSGPDLAIRLLSFLNGLVSTDSIHASFNSSRLHLLEIVKWTLHLMLEVTELYASGIVGAEYAKCGVDATDRQRDDVFKGVQAAYTNGWYSNTSSVASTSVGGDPGNPILLYCKTFLRRILASKLAFDNLEAIAEAALYTTSIDGMQYDIRCQLGLDTQYTDVNVDESDLDDHLFMGSVARVYLLRLLEELVVDGVNEIVEKNGSNVAGALATLPHSGGGSISNQSYLSAAVRRKKLGPGTEGEYIRKDQQAIKILSVFAHILKPVWFACILQNCRDEASASAAFRLLILMHQNTPPFAVAFEEAGGFAPFVLSIPKFTTSPSITLSMLCQLLHAPILHLPCFGNLDPVQLCTVFDAESDAKELIDNERKNGSSNTLSEPSCGIFALLAECLGRNIQLSAVENEVGAKARQTNEAVLALLCHHHTCSSTFQDFCRSPHFLEPLAQALCLLHTRKRKSYDGVVNGGEIVQIRSDQLLRQELYTDDLSLSDTLSAGGDSDLLNISNDSNDLAEGESDEVYLAWPTEDVSDETEQMHKSKVSIKSGSGTERLVGRVDEGRSNGVELIQLLHHIISHAVLCRPYAAPLVSALFRSFPIHASSEQVEVFHIVLIEQFGSVAENALQHGEPIALANCVGVSSVLLDRLMAGFFGTEAICETVKIIMSTLNNVSTPETYASRTCVKAKLDTFLRADAAHIARLTCLGALQCNTADKNLSREVLTAINMSLKQLLFATSTKNNAQSMKSTHYIPPPGSNLNQAWQSASLERCGSSDSYKYSPILAVEGPDRAFIMALMAEVRLILLEKDKQTREEAVLLIVSLLLERHGIMSDILIKEIALETDVVQPIDLLNDGGFGSLLLWKRMRDSNNVPMRQTDLSALDQVQFNLFFEWLEENSSDFEIVFSGIHKEVSRLIPGIYGTRASSPEEATINEQKEMTVKLVSLEESDKTMQGGMERTQLANKSLDKTSDSQTMWKRQGFDYLSSGAMQWKSVLRQLKGSRSIWEGGFCSEEDQPFSFKTLVLDWKLNRTDSADMKSIEAKSRLKDDVIACPPFELVTRWKLDVTEAYERQRRRLLPNYEFHSLYNIDEAMDTHEYNETMTPDDDGTNISDEHNNNSTESTISNPFIESTIVTATLLRGMDLGRNILDEPDFDEPDDSTYQLAESDSYWENYNEEQLVDDDTAVESPSDQPSSCGTNNEMKFNNITTDLTVETENVDTDFNEGMKTDEHQPNRRDDFLASNYDVLIGLLQTGDFPEKSYNVKRCTGLEVCQALLLCCRNAIYVIDGFEQRDEDGLTGEIIRLEKPKSTFNVSLRQKNFGDKSSEVNGQQVNRAVFPQTKKKENIGQDSPDETTHQQHRCKRLDLNDVYAIYRRRYQLQQNALEFYDVLNNGTLIAFEDKGKREEVLSKMLSTPLPNSIFHPSLALGTTLTINYEKFMNSLRARTISQWVQGKISNFDFIMHLNTFAGRSYNDLTQYPIFPWILADYESEEIDLSDPSVYRDLSKPMGALGETRAAQFKERFEALQSNFKEYEPPAFHYGTHYSCAAYVLNYMLRLEPFSRLALSLQGGRFDLADRLFHNIGASWRSASKENLQDVRELIPEFFYLPEFLENSNGFDFGATQHGRSVDHVTLPPWAKGDPRRFVRIHRQALESDHVSRHLHKWVDLIFGFKQRGREAVAALNTFVHVTYEDNVDIDTIEDPIQRKSTIAQIQNFGQTPSRLFGKAFPARNIMVALKDGVFDFGAMAYIQPLTPPFCIVGAPHKVALHVISHSNCSKLGMSGQVDSSVGDMCLTKGQLVGVGKACALIYPGKKYHRFAGSNNGVSVHVASTNSRNKELNMVITIHDNMHRAPITAVRPSRNGQWLITGCIDSTIRVWKYEHNHMRLQATLCGHDGAKITCIDVSTVFGTIVSGDAAGNVLVWDLRTLQYLRQLRHTSSKKTGLKFCLPEPVVCVSLNHKTGDIMTLVGSSVTIFDINGNLVAKQGPDDMIPSTDGNTDPSFAISTDCPEWMEHGIVAVTGHNNGDIRLWGVDRDSELLEMKHLVSEKVHTSPITCLCIEGKWQDKLLAGDISGKMSVSGTVQLEMLHQQDLNKIADEIQTCV